MINIHAAGNFSHICYQMLGAACNAGNSRDPVINSFGNHLYGIHDFCHRSFETARIGIKFVHSPTDIGGVVLVLPPGGNKGKKFFQDRFLNIIY